MRNIYYPQRKAEYVTQAQMRNMNQKDVIIERDFGFGLEQPQSGVRQEDVEAVDAKMTLVKVWVSPQIHSIRANALIAKASW